MSSKDDNRKREEKEYSDLYGPLQRSLMYSKNAYDIVVNYSFIETLGKDILNHNMIYC